MKQKAEKKSSPQQTPLMRQYLEIKSNYEDAILLFRLGDFYEMFFEDAIEASQILDLTLTARNKSEDNPIPLCGMPHHAADGYIQKLIAFGKKVVICEQVEDAKQAKGLVKRDVTQVITPGTVIDEKNLSAKENNFIFCISKNKNGLFWTSCDVTTGELNYDVAKDENQIIEEISRLECKEIVYPETLRDSDLIKKIKAQFPLLFIEALAELYFDNDFAQDTAYSYYQLNSLEALGLDDLPQAISCIGGLLNYLKELKLLTRDLLDYPKRKTFQETLYLDSTTIRHLELFQTQHEENRKGSLFWHLDQCQTAMGSRLLANWIRAPLYQKDRIQERLGAVGEFRQNDVLREGVQKGLEGIFDLERLANRFVTNRANPRDAIALLKSFDKLKEIKSILKTATSHLVEKSYHDINVFSELKDTISKTLVDEPPLQIKDGGLIQDGFHSELDELRSIERDGKKIILELEAQEKEKTKIPSLKIRFNNVFGYYIEVTNTHKDKVPQDYIRKQTLTNSERYITEELKNIESKVLGASERIKTIEYDLFCQLRETIAQQATEIKKTAQAIATLDVLLGFALLSQKHHYCQPEMSEDVVLDLKQAKHPILESMMPGEPFVPNNITLNSHTCLQMIITGPNMAGKSTLMRMVALNVLMAQIGCFVACESATIGLCDRIFTRVGAHDHLQKGLSTFMVEMVETAKILRESSSKSLILLDEIGRGTSTFDGLSLAWAIAEDLHSNIKARTLFATHYHELCDLAEQKKTIRNFHMAVKEWNDDIIFLRKLKPGGTNRSYGVAVANMAGLPTRVIERAKDILQLLEIKDLSFQNQVGKVAQSQMTLFEDPQTLIHQEIIKDVQNLEPETLTPIEALNFLAALKEKI